MDYRYLNAFREAARFESFQLAAKELGIAPSAVTRQIQLFERSTGEDCFVKSGRSIKLTTFGKNIYQQVINFERQLANRGENDSLAIGCLQNVFEGILAEFLAKHAYKIAARITVDVGSPSYLQEQLESGRVDLTLNTRAILESKKIYSEELVYVAKKDSMLNNIEAVTSIIYAPLEDVWESLKLETKTSIRTNSLNAAIELAALGAGFAILPNGSNLKRRGLLTKKIVKHPAKAIYLNYPPYQKLPRPLQTFNDLLHKHIGNAKLSR